jgi:hypothetical protein
MPVVACPTPCPPITRGIVQFLSSEFVALWPAFTGLTSAQQQNAFNQAILLLDNSCGSVVQDANARLTLLYLLTCHVLALTVGTNDGQGNISPPTGIVGRIDSGTQGTVSVSAGGYSSEVTQSEAYFIQTTWGAEFWQATMGYRTMLYFPPPLVGPNSPGLSWGAFGVELE